MIESRLLLLTVYNFNDSLDRLWLVVSTLRLAQFQIKACSCFKQMGAGLLYVFSLRIERFCGLLCVFHSRPNIRSVKKRKTQNNLKQTLSTQVFRKFVRWCLPDTGTTLQTGTSRSRFSPVHLYSFTSYQLIQLNLISDSHSGTKRILLSW